MYNRKKQCILTNDDEENRICTRSNSGLLFHVTKPNCESYKRSVCYSGAVDWNSLGSELRNAENIFAFKKSQKVWLINTYLKK